MNENWDKSFSIVTQRILPLLHVKYEFLDIKSRTAEFSCREANRRHRNNKYNRTSEMLGIERTGKESTFQFIKTTEYTSQDFSQNFSSEKFTSQNFIRGKLAQAL